MPTFFYNVFSDSSILYQSPSLKLGIVGRRAALHPPNERGRAPPSGSGAEDLNPKYYSPESRYDCKMVILLIAAYGGTLLNGDGMLIKWRHY